MSNIKIRLLKNVHGLSLGNSPRVSASKGQEYDAHTNPHGAISVRIDGQLLGVRPDEFKFISAPACVLEKHGKLSEIIGRNLVFSLENGVADESDGQG